MPAGRAGGCVPCARAGSEPGRRAHNRLAFDQLKELAGVAQRTRRGRAAPDPVPSPGPSACRPARNIGTRSLARVSAVRPQAGALLEIAAAHGQGGYLRVRRGPPDLPDLCAPVDERMIFRRRAERRQCARSP